MADDLDNDQDWIDPVTWPNAAAHPEAVAELADALGRALTPYAREHGSARDVATLAVESMAAGGRLLPDGGEPGIEWGVRGADGQVWVPDDGGRNWAEFRAWRVGQKLVRRDITRYADGSSRVGPWVEVTDA